MSSTAKISFAYFCLALAIAGCGSEVAGPGRLINFRPLIGSRLFIHEDREDGWSLRYVDTVVQPDRTFEGRNNILAISSPRVGAYLAYEDNGDISVLEGKWMRHALYTRQAVGSVSRYDYGNQGYSLVRLDTVFRDTTIADMAGAKRHGIKEEFFRTIESYSQSDVLLSAERTMPSYYVWVPELGMWGIKVFHPGAKGQLIRRLESIK